MERQKNTAGGEKNRNFSTRRIVETGVLAAVASVLMFIEFPLPFIAPSFYQLDFSDLPAIVGGFAFGPVTGILVEFLKNVIHIFIKGTTTACIGELGNFIMGCAYVVPAALIYRRKKTKKTAVLALAVSTLVMGAVCVLVNAYLLLPAYSAAFGLPIDTIVAMGAAIHPSIGTVTAFCMLTVLPFNLFKGVMVSVITLLLYKQIRKILK